MTENDPHAPPAQNDALRPARPTRKVAARAAKAGISLVWLVPILVLVATLGMAWNAYSQRGELISVEFSDATGIAAGETVLKFREIAVGKVEAVKFAADLKNVLVEIRVDDSIARYIDDEAEFWIVRPQVSAQGISRLDTVLSGVFIEGYWDSTRGERQDRFVGLDRAPLTREDASGTWVTLASDSANGLSEGAPITYRGLVVGRMENLRLSNQDETVVADAFIEAPYDEKISTATMFWDTSGFSLSLGADGLSFNVASLSSLVQGGAAFETLSSGGEPILRGHVFRLQPDEQTARKAMFIDNENDLRVTMLLSEAVRGLPQGADVQFEGVVAGRVTELGVRVDDNAPEGEQVQQEITLALSPTRLGLDPDSTQEETLDFLSQRVAEGLRARVVSTGLLGNVLAVELVSLPLSAPAQITQGEPFPIMPTAPAQISDVTAQAQSLLSRVGDLPLEETLNSARDMMNSITALATAEATRALPSDLRNTIGAAQTAIEDLGQTSRSLRENDVAAKLAQALEDAGTAAVAIREASADLPEMVTSANEAADAIASFDFAGVSAEAEGILADLRAMLGTEDAEQLPRNLSDTLQSATGLLNDLRDGNAVGSLNAMLDSARRAADQVGKATQDLPTLSARLQQLAARTEGVVAAYGERGQFNTEARTALRELSRAASAFGSLARTIERNPRAFILGR